eukprot:7385501-Prymnesium_polylepis.1
MWEPDKARADTMQMLRQSIQGAKGHNLRLQRFPPAGKKAQVQPKISFGPKASTPPAATATPAAGGNEVADAAARQCRTPPSPMGDAEGSSSAAAEQDDAIGSKDKLPGKQINPELVDDSGRPSSGVCATRVTICKGISLVDLCGEKGIEPFLEPFMSHYPFAYHTSITPWSVPTFDGTVHAIECYNRNHTMVQSSSADEEDAEVACECVRLKSNSIFTKVLERQADSTLHTQPIHDRYLSHYQSKARRDESARNASVAKVVLWHQRKRIAKVSAPLEHYKQMTVLLSQNKLPRTREFFLRMRSRGTSVKKI